MFLHIAIMLCHINCRCYQFDLYSRLKLTLTHQISMKKNQGWEITTASSKLAECQESIINIGKQLKALASSSETAVLDRVNSTTNTMDIPSQKNLIKRASLRNHMLAEDDGKEGMHTSVENEESKSTEDAQIDSVVESEKESALQTPHVTVNGSEQNDRSSGTRNQAIVVHKKYGGFDFLRKLFTRRKKGRSKGSKLLRKA